MITAIKFTTTTLILGMSSVFAVICTVMAFSGTATTSLTEIASSLCTYLAVVSLVKLIWEASIFLKISESSDSILRRSAILMTRDLKYQTVLRFGTGILGGIILPLIVTLHTAATIQSYVILSSAILILTLIGELGERYLYFTAVVRNKMPGGV